LIRTWNTEEEETLDKVLATTAFAWRHAEAIHCREKGNFWKESHIWSM